DAAASNGPSERRTAIDGSDERRIAASRNIERTHPFCGLGVGRTADHCQTGSMSEFTAPIPDWSELNETLEAMEARLAAADGAAGERGTWPEELWSILIEAGATRWALPPAAVGAGAVTEPECDRVTLLERYARVAEGSLTAAFILSQHDAAVR